MKALVLLSGGLDSTVALFWALKTYEDVAAIFFDYGQRHRTWEGRAACAVASKVRRPIMVSRLPWADINPDDDRRALLVRRNGPPILTPEASVLLGRNLVLLGLAAHHAALSGIEQVVFGATGTDAAHYPDCRREFVSALNLTLDVSGNPRVQVVAPFLDQPKKGVVLIARGYRECWEALALTRSCYEASQDACGECPACVVRRQAFAEVGTPDPALVVRVVRS